MSYNATKHRSWDEYLVTYRFENGAPFQECKTEPMTLEAAIKLCETSPWLAAQLWKALYPRAGTLYSKDTDTQRNVQQALVEFLKMLNAFMNNTHGK